MRYGQFTSISESKVDIAQTLTTLATIVTSEMERLCVEIKPTDEAFDQFVIQAKFNEDADFNSMFSAAADFTSPSGILLGASGDLTALAAGATGWFIMSVTGIHSVRLQAASASATLADVSIEGGGN